MEIKTNLNFLDKVSEKGIPVGTCSAIMGESKSNNFLARFIPDALANGYTVHFNLEQAEAITKHGQCLIDEMLKRLKSEGFDMSSIKPVKTVHEKIGNTVFPVTYHENGMVIIDYPTKP